MDELELVKLSIQDSNSAFRHYVGEDWADKHSGTVLEEIRKGEFQSYIRFLVNDVLPGGAIKELTDTLKQKA